MCCNKRRRPSTALMPHGAAASGNLPNATLLEQHWQWQLKPKPLLYAHSLHSFHFCSENFCGISFHFVCSHTSLCVHMFKTGHFFFIVTNKIRNKICNKTNQSGLPLATLHLISLIHDAIQLFILLFLALSHFSVDSLRFWFLHICSAKILHRISLI